MTALNRFSIDSPDFNKDGKISKEDMQILLPLLKYIGPDEVLRLTTKTRKDLDDLEEIVNINLGNIDEIQPELIFLGSKIKEKKLRLDNASKHDYIMILDTLFQGLTFEQKEQYKKFLKKYEDSALVSRVLITILGIDNKPVDDISIDKFLSKFGSNKAHFESTYNQMLEFYYQDNLKLLQDIAQVFMGNIAFDNLLH